MGRRRTHDLDLPPHMYRKVRGGQTRYYYGRAGVALGSDFPTALRRYAELHAGHAAPGTFAEAARLYRQHELPTKAPRTRAGYGPQLDTLVAVFGHMALDAMRPRDVADFMAARSERTVDKEGRRHGGPIVATREKALLSAVFAFARAKGLTNAPNPCAGIRGTKAKRGRYVTDAEVTDAITRAAPMLAAFLELCYRTGQRPGDVLKMRRQDAQDGALWVQQGKTGAKVRIELVGPLAALVARLTAAGDGVPSVFLIRDRRGQPLTLAAMRKRFDRLGCDWQIRDLRAKAASDSKSAREAQALLGHAAASTTDGYIRQVAGAVAQPISRRITDKPS